MERTGIWVYNNSSLAFKEQAKIHKWQQITPCSYSMLESWMQNHNTISESIVKCIVWMQLHMCEKYLQDKKYIHSIFV